MTKRPINESFDPRFGKTRPQDSLLRDAVKVINGMPPQNTNINTNNQSKPSSNDASSNNKKE